MLGNFEILVAIWGFGVLIFGLVGFVSLICFYGSNEKQKNKNINNNQKVLVVVKKCSRRKF